MDGPTYTVQTLWQTSRSPQAGSTKTNCPQIRFWGHKNNNRHFFSFLIAPASPINLCLNLGLESLEYSLRTIQLITQRGNAVQCQMDSYEMWSCSASIQKARSYRPSHFFLGIGCQPLTSWLWMGKGFYRVPTLNSLKQISLISPRVLMCLTDFPLLDSKPSVPDPAQPATMTYSTTLSAFR